MTADELEENTQTALAEARAEHFANIAQNPSARQSPRAGAVPVWGWICGSLIVLGAAAAGVLWANGAVEDEREGCAPISPEVAEKVRF